MEVEQILIVTVQAKRTQNSFALCFFVLFCFINTTIFYIPKKVFITAISERFYCTRQLKIELPHVVVFAVFCIWLDRASGAIQPFTPVRANRFLKLEN